MRVSRKEPGLPTTADDAGAIMIGNAVLGLKARLAPRNSFRERMLHVVTRPLTSRMLRRQLERAAAGPAPVTSVVRWQGITGRAASLPERPRILIMKIDHIGDFVTGMPAMEELRAGFPGARFTLVCASWNRPWAERMGWFEEIVEYDFFTKRQADWNGATEAQVEAFAALALGRFDIAIDLRHDVDTRPLLARVDAAFRAGFRAPADGGGAMLDIALPEMERVSVQAGTGLPVHASLRLRLLALAVTASFGAQAAHPANALVTGDSRQKPRRPFAILAPGAGSLIRCWPVARMTEVARRLLDDYDFDLVLVGGPAEAAAGAEMAASLPAERTRDLCGILPLAELPDLIRDCALYVGCDTGTTHLAAALGAPTVAIISGVPDIDVWYPMGPDVDVVAGRVACSPCRLVDPKTCPFGVTCLNSITAEHVWHACRESLTRSGGRKCAAGVAIPEAL
jgi:ADP-heptose:LPS heptosyltransferase